MDRHVFGPPGSVINCTDPDNPMNVSENSDLYQNVTDPEHWQGNVRHISKKSPTNIVTKIVKLVITLIESSRLPADSTSSITSAPKPRAITLRAMSSGDTASQQ